MWKSDSVLRAVYVGHVDSFSVFHMPTYLALHDLSEMSRREIGVEGTGFWSFLGGFFPPVAAVDDRVLNQMQKSNGFL